MRRTSRKRDRLNRERRAVLSRLHGPQPCTVMMARQIAGLDPLPGCTRTGQDPNEIRTRARGGSITDPGNINLPCRPCHTHLTDTPRSELGWAYQLGLIKQSWEE